MNADVRPIKTAAETALADSFAAAKDRLPGAGPLAALRAEAFRQFSTSGLPHRRVEEWKYTDLRALMRDAKPLAGVPDAAAKARARNAGASLASIEGRRIVFIDGAFAPELSDLAGLEAGLSIGSMGEALAAADPQVTSLLGKLVPTDDVAVALNTAFMGDGAVIRVGQGAALARPLHLVFVNAGGTPAAVFTRSLVVIEKGARAMLVESHEGPAASEHQVNAALELKVGDEAHVDHVKITGEGAGALHVSTLMAAVGAHARFNEFLFTTGGTVVRNQLFVRFDGEGTIAGIRGASLLRGRQHADTTLIADHVAAGCTGREVFKSVIDDEGRAVFQGKIIVRPEAQKTDARMATHALLLSENAEADNKPELEIFADDVQCGHGATAGDLDEDLLFYLKARGIPPKDAEALLIQAFVGEAVEGIEHAGLRDALMDQVAAWLEARARR
ncbi:MAG TPA: Fe-S cluster assembly protein SufD [Xanthobacteraceae bacterium]|nr:Fe-S cluster assembly protein SufD [Xanthobacteraceae bacterium]